MISLATQLWNDEQGVIVSAELVLVASVSVLAVLVGLDALVQAVNFELNDVSNAVSSLNQSYAVSGLRLGRKAFVGGSAYFDSRRGTTLVSYKTEPQRQVEIGYRARPYVFENQAQFQDRRARQPQEEHSDVPSPDESPKPHSLGNPSD